MTVATPMSHACQTHGAASGTTEQLFGQELGDAIVDVLLLMRPLLEILHGDKRTRLRAAYARLSCAYVRRQLNDLSVPIPARPRGVALSLHRAVLDLCKAYGLTSIELIDSYNLFADETAAMRPGDALAQMKALLALLIAEGLVAS
jgi:hypothetical protein